MNLALLGTPATFEFLAFWTGIAMLLGALAFAYPLLTLAAVAYTGLDIIAAELDENRAFFDTHNEAPENSDAGTL